MELHTFNSLYEILKQINKQLVHAHIAFNSLYEIPFLPLSAIFITYSLSILSMRFAMTSRTGWA
ncbi:MAG: hypothetical protein ACP5UU_06280, partial [Thermoprotei archaeon]